MAMSLYYEWRIGLISLSFVPLTAAILFREGKMIMQDSFMTVEAMERSTEVNFVPLLKFYFSIHKLITLRFK